MQLDYDVQWTPSLLTLPGGLFLRHFVDDNTLILGGAQSAERLFGFNPPKQADGPVFYSCYIVLVKPRADGRRTFTSMLRHHTRRLNTHTFSFIYTTPMNDCTHPYTDKETSVNIWSLKQGCAEENTWYTPAALDKDWYFPPKEYLSAASWFKWILCTPRKITGWKSSYFSREERLKCETTDESRCIRHSMDWNVNRNQ